MDKKVRIIIIAGIILLLVIFILAIILGPVCVSDSTCKNYCYHKGNEGVLSLTPVCHAMLCECTCPSGMCM